MLTMRVTLGCGVLAAKNPSPSAGCMTNHGATRSAIANTSAEMSVGPEARHPASYCQVKSCIGNAHHIVKAPPDREFAANRRRRSDWPVHEHAARHPCQPPTDQCPISGGNANYLQQP